MILSKKNSVLIADLYCNEPVADVKADVIRYNQWSSPTPGTRIPPLNTILIDLTLPVDGLLAACKKDTRYEIRRAEKDALSIRATQTPSDALIDEFCAAYNDSIAARGLPEMKPESLAPLAREGALEISTAHREELPALAWHVYYRGHGCAVLLHSVSPQRNATDGAARQLIGRANRFLHWQDVIRLKAEGVHTLDMGGWYGGSDDAALLQINKFKEEFGGRIVDIYNSMEGVTLKGKAALKVLELRRSLHDSAKPASGARSQVPQE